MAGNSCQSEAVRRIVTDKCCDALRIFQGCALADVEKFYGGLRVDTLVPAALKMDVNSRTLMILMPQRPSTGFA